MKKKIEMYILPRQVGKSTRIIEQFIMAEMRRHYNKSEDLNFIVCMSSSSRIQLIQKIERLKYPGSIDSSWRLQILTPNIPKGIDRTKVNRVFIDEYEHYLYDQKKEIFKFLYDEHENIIADVTIYSSLKEMLFLRENDERGQMYSQYPNDLTYHPDTIHLPIDINFYNPNFSNNEKIKTIGLEAFKKEYKPTESIL